MSPRSLDPISRRPDKPGDKPAEAKGAKKEAARTIPNTADRDQMLAKAQANLRAKKEKKARGRRKTVLAVVLVVLAIFLAGGAFLGYKSYQKQKYFAVIDGKPVSRSEYDRMMQLAEKNKVNKDEATKKYLEAQKKKLALEKLNVAVSAASLSMAGRSIDPKKPYTELDDWQKLMAYDMATQTALDNAKTGGYDITLFYFPFSQHQETLGYAYQSAKPAGYRDPAVVADDKQYAQSKLDLYRKQIESNASQQNVLSSIWADKRLQYAGAPNNSRNFMLVVSDKSSQENLSQSVFRLYSKDIDVTKLNKQASVGLSANLTGQMIMTDLPKKPSYDAYYYFYKVNAYYEPKSSVQNDFQNAINNMKVETNG